MQPNLLSPEQEEKQSESLDLQEITQPHFSVVTEATPLEPVPVIEPTSTPPAPIVEKKRSKLNIPAIILGIFVFILLVAATGLGYWAYTLRTELITTQQQLTALRGDHSHLQTDYATLKSEKEKLTGEREKLNVELTQSKADLEKANADLTATQADLKQSQDQNKSLRAQIDKASKLAEVLYASMTSNEPSDVFKIDSLVKKANDQQLITKWDEFTTSPSQDAFWKFFNFLVGYIRVTLK